LYKLGKRDSTMASRHKPGRRWAGVGTDVQSLEHVVDIISHPKTDHDLPGLRDCLILWCLFDSSLLRTGNRMDLKAL